MMAARFHGHDILVRYLVAPDVCLSNVAAGRFFCVIVILYCRPDSSRIFRSTYVRLCAGMSGFQRACW
jgi:hypothetical protein